MLIAVQMILMRKLALADAAYFEVVTCSGSIL